MFNSSVAKSVISIATTKCNLSIQEMFFRAILCNILVCVAVMMAATSKTDYRSIPSNYGIRNLWI